MLPEALLCLLSATLAFAQARTTLGLNAVAPFTSSSLPKSFALPPSQNLALSVAICSGSTPIPRFFISNISNSDSQDDPSSAGGLDVFEISVQNGQGNWTGPFPNGGLLAVEQNGAQGISFQLGVSDSVPMHQVIPDSPFLGDTTSNQALLFSSPYLPVDTPAPTYPNYTLPAANMSQPDQPTSSPNFTLKIFSTSAGFANKPHTACFLQSQVSEGSIASQTQWVRDNFGWRTQWLLGGLTPSTNYTAFVLQSTNV
ncbi:hypothetical protein HYPSUDRAFT_46602, partial [Hypholoma sublateritium FD-334 SS-4]